MTDQERHDDGPAGRRGSETTVLSDDEPAGAESVREAVERSRSGAPAVGAVVRDRFSSDEVFQRIVAAADEEITSGSRELFFSALAAGFAITITFMLYVSLTAKTGGDAVLSALLYPLGFIYIIIGRYQLYTENTLPPVALTIERIASVPALLRNWSVVLAGNFTGGALGALALAYGGVLSPEASVAAVEIAQEGVETEWWSLFSKAAFAGLVVAGVVWVEYAARDTISRLTVVYLAFLAIPLGGLFHSVVSFTEMVYLVLHGQVAFLVGMWEFVIPVLLGNTLGGVLLVTVVNYFQTSEHRLESARFEGADRQLSIKEWAFGRFAGRSYVPLIDTGEMPPTEGDTILVPIANPRTESELVELACSIANGREDANVHVVHVVQIPDGSPRGYGASQRRRIVEESDELLGDARETARRYDVPFQTSTVLSHRSFEELFNIAERESADLVLMSWGDNRLWASGRAERPLSELTRRLPSDFLVFDGDRVDASRLLLPVGRGPNCELSADVARALQTTTGAEVSLLHVVDGPGEREDGEQFLTEWAAENGLADAALIVDDGGDLEDAIAREAADHSLLVVGATEEGLLSRLVTESLYFDVINGTDIPVLLAEQAGERSLRERLFG
ncbi:Formate/nitrite transporter FocA, FNT family [Natronoarchaeum philippinense]|uniref:Formate/nitrite transporter FocA, FNT family n=1 Tax=Natronoarchaeum philippinense TaxID=558529 RepID=A0A285N327_NATPI|nr:formate/nitrite transporter family protein [Natronoarchaeum philippinense]SNZ03227.1 Formate/nitrite transporter FocA, FNT family [Natronoarchaeum philippinense]